MAAALVLACRTMSPEQTQQSSACEPVRLSADFTCVALRWLVEESAPEPIAFTVPIEIGDRMLWFQVDTGLDATTIYGEQALERAGLTAGANARDVRVKAKLGLGTQTRAQSLHINRTMKFPNDDDVAGSLGLDFFAGRVAIFDFARGQLCLANTLGPDAQQFGRSRAELRDGKLFVTLQIDEVSWSDVFYDSGSHTSALVVDQPDWQALTGLADAKDAQDRRPVNSWGTTLTVLTHPMRGSLRVGAVEVSRAPVSFLRERPKVFGQWNFACRGLFGNALFAGRALLLDLEDPDHPQFGLSRCRGDF